MLMLGAMFDLSGKKKKGMRGEGEKALEQLRSWKSAELQIGSASGTRRLLISHRVRNLTPQALFLITCEEGGERKTE